MINVIGIYFMNSPIIPSQRINGKNAAKVVAVDAIIGIAISPTACFAASQGAKPLSIKRCMFSTTTMALSTSIPNARIKENNTIMFILKSMAPITTKEINMDIGIASPTKRASRVPKKKNKTAITKITPIIMLFSRLLNCIFTISL